ncbi:hypothetical protein RHGRI_001831 [Rhododendron griersonianum]|uniref:Uncharacterized protein n=1 Tax=Rhododendron griersonianum TaxID=479676 RepID=A0AAV6LM53_9ERIC|nr:hypothetical protein RHGRI_001831 [Rhododendron griersonianum]
MTVMQKLRMFVVQEPVVAASCLIAGVVLFHQDGMEFRVQTPDDRSSQGLSCLTGSSVVNVSGLFLPAVVRPILDSFETPKQAPPPALNEARTTVYCTFSMIKYNVVPITMLVCWISSVACVDVSGS